MLVCALDARCMGVRLGGPSAQGLGLGAETLGRAEGSEAEGAGDGGFIDVLAWLNYMTFDVISDLAFGAPLGMLARGTDVLPEADTDNNAVSSQETEDSGIAALIDYRGRAAALLGLFPFHPRIHALLHRYARWVPDGFIRRGVSGTEVSHGFSVIA